MTKSLILTCIIYGLFFCLAGSASAHGSMQKIVEGKYLLNLSSAPISPLAGQKQQNILALSDVATDSLITANSIFDVEISKDGKTVYAARNLVATGGLLQLTSVYPDAGTYEFFVKFHLPGESHVYEPEDFWVQVNPAAVTIQRSPLAASMPWLVVAAIVGFIIGRRSR